MSPLKLLPSDEAVLATADRAAVVDAMSGLYLKNIGAWLPAGHPAEHGVQRDHAPGKESPISSLHLAEYLAIATPNHCADGWAYLSRALNAYLIGDAHSSWHFAYYAELRAAQSILSGLGCGVFDSWNCVLNSGGAIVALSEKGPARRTHAMVWLALDYLADNVHASAEVLANATMTLGESLPNIVRHAYAGRSLTSTSSAWIRSWMLDIRNSSSDKHFRNKCSYFPHVATPHRADIGECIDLVASLWEVLEPSPGAAFLELDKEIIRGVLLRTATESLELNGERTDDVSVERELGAAYDRVVSAAPMFSKVARAFIANGNATEHPILQHAKDDSTSPDTPRPALARATLLLRIASGVTENLLRDSRKVDELDFWLNALAVQQGIITNQKDAPDDRLELYSECAYAAQGLEKNIARGFSTRKQLVEKSGQLPHLASQVERVVQWGFGT